MYFENSTIFGSIKTSFTSSGLPLYRRLSRMELTQTDLPEPVVPAMSRCGIFARSVATMLPEMSRPSTTVSLLFSCLNSLESISSRMVTMPITLFGTSIPIAALPGIGASILTPSAARFSAISSERFVILLIFTPAAGCSSKRVTDGPRQILMILACTPKLLSVDISFCPFSCSSSNAPLSSPEKLGWSKSTGG